MSTAEQKAAESRLKAAEKAHAAAAKKADDALEKYRPLRAAANRAARALAHAKTDPDLFQDDDLEIVLPAFGGTIVAATVEVPEAQSAPPVADVTHDSPITVAGVPAEQRAGGEVVHPPQDVTAPDVEPPVEGDEERPPWVEPVEPPKAKRTRRIAPKKDADAPPPEETQPPEPSAEIPDAEPVDAEVVPFPDDDEPPPVMLDHPGGSPLNPF